MAEAASGEPTSRESAVLAAVERRLTNLEIAAELHVSVRTVESHIASLRRKLGVKSRAALIAAARERRGAAVPVPHDSFVGRQQDVDLVTRLLDSARWVTIVGPAGCGKTRLVLELAANDRRTPTVVQLEHVTDREVPSAVAAAVGIGGRSSDPLAACGVALTAQRCLLVLDNCDRVAGAVAEVVRRLLALAPSLSVLATSRGPVDAPAETVYVLDPLPVGSADDSAAVDLFVDRARAAAPSLAPTTEDRDVIAAICRRLDGLPLAIELAAARLRHLSLAELAHRLERSLAALDRAAGSGRHRTLRAALDWTWDLLDRDEQDALARLAALPRTFDLDLAEAVCGEGAAGTVLRLLDRSLVTYADRVTEPRRFRLLDPVRTRVLECVDKEVVSDVRRRHATYHAELVAELAGRARHDDSRPTVLAGRILQKEAAAALGWAVSEDEGTAVPLAAALSVLIEQCGPDADSLAAVAAASRDVRFRAALSPEDLMPIGLALCYDDLDLVAELAELALAKASDRGSRLAAHHLAGYAAAYRGRRSDAMDHLTTAERLAREPDDGWHRASILQARGIAMNGAAAADPAEVIETFEAAMRAYGEAGDAMHVNNSRYMMAAVAAESGIRTEDARRWAEQCVSYAEEVGNPHERGHALLTRARLTRGEAADSDLQSAAQTFRAIGDLRCLVRSLLLEADRAAARERVPLLQQAVEVARRARDARHEATSLERLITALWDSGARRSAVVALGELVGSVGYEDAVARCPAAMAAELVRWEAALVEGKARRTASARTE